MKIKKQFERGLKKDLNGTLCAGVFPRVQAPD